MPSLSSRLSLYHSLSTDLAYFNNDQLKPLVQNGADSIYGWGANHAITVGKFKVFVKSIPVADLEYTNPFATKNLYDLPTYYNYGVGSAGFGVWRELVTHIKTTNWVLSGACENFPLMYHFRIVPRSSEYSILNQEDHEQYVTYWNSNPNIGQYMLDRRNAKYALVLFLEYFPYVLDSWLGKNTAQLDLFLNELRDTVTFLRKNGIIHFDAHLGNMVTDGEHPYLTDFGLVLDKQFDLSESEQALFKLNSHYDYGEVLTGLGWLIRRRFEQLSKPKQKKVLQKYSMTTDTPWPQRYLILLENAHSLYADGLMNLDKSLVDAILKYRDIILLMLKFFTDMRGNNRKDTKFKNAKLKRLLEQSEFLLSPKD
ncbi:MAG: hypothetical protein Fur0022_21510 [Anaerolineales bacterium]